MLKKWLLMLLACVAVVNIAFAQVDVNTADKAALDGIKGVGPAMSQRILDERKKGGEFKGWADFQKRVKGIGDKSAVKLSTGGLRVKGVAKDGAAVPPQKKIPSKK